MGTRSLGKDIGIRAGLVIMSVYLGTIFGSLCYRGFKSFDIAVMHPEAVFAVLAASIFTPKAQFIFGACLILSFVFLFVRRLPYWCSVFLFVGYSILTYVLTLMWRS